MHFFSEEHENRLSGNWLFVLITVLGAGYLGATHRPSITVATDVGALGRRAPTGQTGAGWAA